MAKKYISKTEADSLAKISIFQLNKDGSLGSFPIRIEIIDSMERIEDSFLLTSTACYFGGRRYWIKCHCERKVGVLYKDGDYFACRHCHDLSYRSKNENKTFRGDPLFKMLNYMIKVNNLKDKIKRETYGGEATNNQQRLNLLYAKLVLTTIPA